MEPVLTLLLWGGFGFWLWRRLVVRGLPTERLPSAGTGLVGLFLIGWVTSLLATAAVQHVLATTAEVEVAELGFAATVRALTAGNAAAILIVALVAYRQAEDTREGLGLGPARLRAPFLAALAVFLMTRPLLALLAWLGELVLDPFLGPEAERGPQLLVEMLMAADGEPTVTTWIVICVVIPFGEELLFRGALYGGLRPRLGVLGAALVSGLLFGLLHADLLVLLPLTGFGVVLALVRERTGTLTVPTLLHGLNNASAILIAKAMSEAGV